jgi:hypothetical protein
MDGLAGGSAGYRVCLALQRRLHSLPLMKAERRHELQTNTLALWLRWRAPEVWAKYGTHILLGIIVILLAIVLGRHLLNKPVEEANRAGDLLSAARDQIREINDGVRSVGEARATLTLIQQAMEQSKRPEIQSEGELAMGDYYWALFNSPAPPGSETRPVEVTEEKPEELLDKAEQNYSAAMKDGASRPYVGTRARFGLAAVAEARGFDAMRKAGFKGTDAGAYWDKAREQYLAIENDAGAPQALKDEAKWHLEQLKEVSKPIWVAAPPPTTATTGSAGGPSTQGASELPEGLKALQGLLTPQPANDLRPMPATRPTTGPATRPAR